MLYILVVNHCHELVGAQLHQHRYAKVIGQQNQLLVCGPRDVVRNH
jgi:hypothetical protein